MATFVFKAISWSIDIAVYRAGLASANANIRELGGTQIATT